ncbi:hypothetical protein PLEOSDRAFT_1108203 [Pleurotus ostreatus PC15]|uniref:Uncharacterized protein n=1 Tax=Pleurotus ostreatus (strain PC15) TaxID=1137138 RepID=A0A067N9S6_PLEO1|nr:hypothetical protein PLEOSDRAFT_1108203 [Pleurotus ostreatus PC15]
MNEKVQGTPLSGLWDKEDFTDQDLADIVVHCMKQQAQTSGRGASILPYFVVLDVSPTPECSTTSPLVRYDTTIPAKKTVYAEEYHSDSMAVDDKVFARKAYKALGIPELVCKVQHELVQVRSSREMYDISKEALLTISSGSIEGPEGARWSMIKAIWNWDSLPCVPVYDDGKASIPCPVQYSLEEQDIWEKRLGEALRVTLLQTTYTRQVGLAENWDGDIVGTEADFKTPQKRCTKS